MFLHYYADELLKEPCHLNKGYRIVDLFAFMQIALPICYIFEQRLSNESDYQSV